MPETKKYLNRDGLEEYNSLLPHSSGEMQDYVDDWLDAHPEATTTVQDGAISEPKLADKSVSLRTLADDTVHMLKGMMLTKEISGEVLTADDAYSAPPVALTVEGKSTQDGTPTPDNPVPIDSIEVLEFPVTFVGKNNATTVLIPMQGHVLRSLPNGTHDTMSLSYLRKSDRDGWAWYSRELVQKVGRLVINDELLQNTSSFNYIRDIQLQCVYIYTYAYDQIIASSGIGYASNLIVSTNAGIDVVSNYGNNARIKLYLSMDYFNVTYEEYVKLSQAQRKAVISPWFRDNPVELIFCLTTPVTTQLDQIELPVLPAPNCTVWADPSTGLKMQYMRNSNLVIQRIEEAIADQ